MHRSMIRLALTAVALTLGATAVNAETMGRCNNRCGRVYSQRSHNCRSDPNGWAHCVEPWDRVLGNCMPALDCKLKTRTLTQETDDATQVLPAGHLGLQHTSVCYRHRLHPSLRWERTARFGMLATLRRLHDNWMLEGAAWRRLRFKQAIK
jgi:hypothetical protein